MALGIIAVLRIRSIFSDLDPDPVWKIRILIRMRLRIRVLLKYSFDVEQNS